MIIQHTADNQLVLFQPEDLAERKKLDAFPGLSRQGLQFFCPNKQHIVYNLYTRLCRKFKNIKYTSAVKEMIDGDLVIRDIPEWFKFHTEPLRHQLIALRFGYTFGSFLNLSEPGLGKTKVTLDYIWLLRAQKSLIVCPKSLRFVWEEEAIKHRPELKVYVVKTTDWELEKPAIDVADVVVINYDKAVTLEEALKGLKFDFVAVDEGLIKNPSTERTKALTRLSKGIKHRCVMSGTLVNNSPLDVFAPLRFIEPSLVGESFSKFRDEYALVSKKNRFITVGYRNVPEVKEMLASCGVIMTKKEWLTSLPPKQFIHKYVQMGDVQRDYYQKLGSNYILQIPEVDAEIEVDNPLSVLIKLNQISNGFIYYKDNDEETVNDLYGTEGRKGSKGLRKTFYFEEQPKIQALLKLIDSDEFNQVPEVRQVEAGNGTSGRKSDTESSVSGTGQSDTRTDAGRRSQVHRRDNGSDDGTDSSGGTQAVRSDMGDTSGHEDTQRQHGPGHVTGDATGGDSPDAPGGYGSERTSGDGDTRSGCSQRSIGRASSTDKTSRVHNDTDGPGSNVHDSTSKICDQHHLEGRLERDYQQGSTSGDESIQSIPSPQLSEPDRWSNVRQSCQNGEYHRRAIIWFNLDAERDILERNLTASGVSFLVIAGGCKDVGGTVRRFNSDPTIRFLLCQAKTINYGVTIMGTKEEDLADDVFPEFDPQVSDEIFYSLNFSLEVFLQQQDRIHRIGQTRACRYWIILTNSKIERRIADRLEEKMICNKEILVDIMNSLEQDMLETTG